MQCFLHEAKRLAAEVHAAEFFQTFARVGADHGHLRVMFGGVRVIQLFIVFYQQLVRSKTDRLCELGYVR